MKIYTKTGDEGNTSLYDGTRLQKNSLVFNILGNIDHLSSSIGEICALMSDKSRLTYYEFFISLFGFHTKKMDEYEIISENLRIIQSHLLDFGSMFATPSIKQFEKLPEHDTTKLTEELEIEIDYFTTKVPKLTKFILPGVTVIDSVIHRTRCISRNVERSCLDFPQLEHNSYERYKDKFHDMFKYLNRLSDYFFQLGRYVTYLENHEDCIYIN